VAACDAAGIRKDRLLLDPGFGFGKTLEHNLKLLRHLDRLVELGLPLVVGMSRKSMLGALTGRPVNCRMAGSVAAAVLAVAKGARIVRAHDVAETVDAIKVASAVLGN
jgi:dihydropteroate synthase